MFILMDAHQRNEGGNNNERSESEESSWSGTTLQDRVNVRIYPLSGNVLITILLFNV